MKMRAACMSRCQPVKGGGVLEKGRRNAETELRRKGKAVFGELLRRPQGLGVPHVLLGSPGSLW